MTGAGLPGREREPLPPNDRRLALRARGVLAEANSRDILHAADVHVARRLCVLAGEDDPQVALALALTTRAVRTGSVAMDLSAVTAIDPTFDWPQDPEDWLARVAASPLVRHGFLRIEYGLVYLERYHEQEVLVASALRERRALPPAAVDEARLAAGLARLFPDSSDADQRAAADLAVREKTVIITGGPGTGKTTTIAKVLALLAGQYAADGSAVPRVALAAPTAKAAARLSEAFVQARDRLPDLDRAALPEAPASTLHRLLGWTPQSRSRFKHHRGARLPHDIVVLDEASMVSLTMMARLLEALRPTARLIIVGDPDQLTSVEAGAVLADLVAGLTPEMMETPDGTPAGAAPEEFPSSPPDPPALAAVREQHTVARLRHTYRFGGDIGDLARAIRDGHSASALRILRSGSPALELLESPEPRRELIVSAALAMRERALADDPVGALAALGRHRLLCAHRTGPFGVAHWNRQIEQWLAQESGDNLWAPMYPGRPLLMTTNDYAMDLFNGDTGVVIRRDHRLLAAFESGATIREVSAARLADVETMYAATVHKSQGSQASRVTVILPEVDSPLLTRELIYTAATRAQEQLTIVGSPEAIERGLSQRIQRASGLARRLRAAHAPDTGPRAGSL